MKLNIRQIVIAIVVLFYAAGLTSCKKEQSNTNTPPVQVCETNNTGKLLFYNNTTNDWYYEYKADNDIITYGTPISANSNLSEDVSAGKFYTISWVYDFKYNDSLYQWVKQTTRQDVSQCSKNSISLDDDCDTHDIGYLIYVNHTNSDITITIDGASYPPLSPEEVRGFPVAASVTHDVRGSSASGNYHFSPSVGKCQRAATVLL